MHCISTPIPNQSSRHYDGSPSRNAKPSENKSIDYSKANLSEKLRKPHGSQIQSSYLQRHRRVVTVRRLRASQQTLPKGPLPPTKDRSNHRLHGRMRPTILP